MEYVVGSIVTLIVVIVLNRAFKKEFAKATSSQKIRYSQSHIYGMVSDILDQEFSASPLKTQSQKYIDAMYVRVMIVEKQAYWIKENKLFVADMVDGTVDKETTREVDTMSMSKVQLEKTMFVVEKLTEGEDDISNSGFKKF
jgi:hypothetical protein